MLLPSGEGGKGNPSSRVGAHGWRCSPHPWGASAFLGGRGRVWDTAAAPAAPARLTKAGFTPPPLIHAGAFRGEQPLPPLPEAALRLLRGFQRWRRGKGRLCTQMKGKRCWEKGGQGLSLHGDEGKQMNPGSCTAAASPGPAKECRRAPKISQTRQVLLADQVLSARPRSVLDRISKAAQTLCGPAGFSPRQALGLARRDRLGARGVCWEKSAGGARGGTCAGKSAPGSGSRAGGELAAMQTCTPELREGQRVRVPGAIHCPCHRSPSCPQQLPHGAGSVLSSHTQRVQGKKGHRASLGSPANAPVPNLVTKW